MVKKSKENAVERESLKSKLNRMLDSKITLTVNTALGGLALLLYLSAHTVLGFIGHYTFSALPYILGFLMAISAVTSVVLMVWNFHRQGKELSDKQKKTHKVLLITTLCVNIFCLIVALAYFLGMSTHYQSMFVEMGQIFVYYLFAAVIIYLAFYNPKLNFRGKNIVAIVLVAVLLGGTVLGFTDFKTLTFNYNTEGAAVYVVGDDYQIVWRTRVKGIAWVEIDGNEYYDTYAGSKRSTSRVHKVTVPQEILDNARGYTINSKAMISEQGYSGILGYTVKKSYTFRPVNTEDGIQAYIVSDVHDHLRSVKKAAKYYGDKLDFVVLNGDIVSFLESENDAARVLNTANVLSGGTIPVIYTRGNHELKSPASESFHNFVGSIDEHFYFTFRLKNIWGVVLDLGEDHIDSWYEFYGTALYEQYRQEQIAFLDGIIANKENEYEADGVEYRLAISHVATAISSFEEDYMFDDLVAINERLNQMNLDVSLSGHLHESYAVEAGYGVGENLYYNSAYKKSTSDNPPFVATGANYPSIIGSRSADVQDPNKSTSLYGSGYIGVALELNPDEKTVRFTNSKGDVLYTVSAFANIEYGRVVYL